MCLKNSNYYKLILALVIQTLTFAYQNEKTSKCLSGQDKEAQEAKFVEMTNNTIYKQWMRPETTTYVKLSIEMYSMASVDEMDSEYDIQILLDLEWNDQRLMFNDTNCGPDEDLTIEGSEWHLERIWSPKLRVPDNKIPSALDRDAKIILLRVSNNGHVRVRKRLNLVLFCRMHFHDYPFDSQKCNLSFVSSDLSHDYLVLSWADKEPFVRSDYFFMTGFSLVNQELHTYTKVSRSEEFSVVTVTFHLEREWSHYLLDIYLPSMLIVVVSWISFWMEISTPPARIAIGVTTMLTLVTVAKEARENLPVVSYINALDIWFVVCTSFIFLSLVEFAVVSYIYRAEKRKLKEKKIMRRNFSNLSMLSEETNFTFTTNDANSFLCPPNTANPAKSYDGIEILIPKSPTLSSSLKPVPPPLKSVKVKVSPPESPNQGTKCTTIYNPFKMTPQEIAESIDRKCRYIFPILFLLFSLTYWIYYCLL